MTVSNAKIMAMKKLKAMRKYGLGIQGSLAEGDKDDEDNTDTVGLPTKPKMHAIGKFETLDSSWKATIDGEVEKFMYPSLRLEKLYPKEDLNSSFDTDSDTDTNDMPSSKTIDEALTKSSKVNWELERVPPSPTPQAIVEEKDSKRLQFDQKLVGAEAILRKREVANLRLSAAPSDHVDAASTRKSSSLGEAIQVLDLSDNRLTDASIIPLLQSLEAASSPLPDHKNPAPTASDVPSTDNRTAKAKLLAAVSRAAHNANSPTGCTLTMLNLSKNELGREGCRQIARFLATCSTLAHLDLSHTTLGGDDEALAPLASAIESHPSLKHVNLSHNSIGERGGILLGAMLTNASCVVQVLDVSWNNIRRNGAVALGMAMRTNAALRTLHMSMNRCGDGGGEQLAAALGCNMTLKQLDLSHNALTGASAVAFGFFLRENSSLQTLDMKDNNLGEVGARALMRAIALGSRLQFSTANPTGHWSLVLRDTRQRKLALWFASLNAYHAAFMARYHPKRTDCSQYGHGFNWRNVYFNQKAIQLTYAFFDRLPSDGVLEFDYVSPIRPEDRSLEFDEDSNYQESTELDQTLVQSMQVPISDQDLATLLEQIGAEICAIYVPVHKRQNLKYQLVLFHLAIAGRRVMTRQAHHILQHFPKNYESGRLRALVAMHHAIVDLECFGELLERLAVTDRSYVYVHLGYLSTVTPLAVDMDFEVDFTREDEKLLLRALVDLSISCPMDMIRIDSSRSTVLIIYSMYQTNTVPATGRICFRYVTHQTTNRLEWLRARQQIYRHFLCGDRLKSLSDSAALALVANDNSSNTTSAGASSTDGGNALVSTV
ncbi:hypothetical protein JM18_008563 [Phytophthora kernoviae]|uniref:Uncharacterized protein n=2 Tax=Phytophthora kernoviae TaxID=325452 RepID=A0A8T0LZ21_9STRA|nr:hypothetical protein G195_006919 [Phytophthora kernoviae 00238/432]KAG2510889.1 hypothetical protein JM18_008563 [Phytophthora kernoviae]KAG2524964.1 hypothetical protein JM16_004586 [Phytophthora kernoviae]